MACFAYRLGGGEHGAHALVLSQLHGVLPLCLFARTQDTCPHIAMEPPNSIFTISVSQVLEEALTTSKVMTGRRLLDCGLSPGRRLGLFDSVPINPIDPIHDAVPIDPIDPIQDATDEAAGGLSPIDDFFDHFDWVPQETETVGSTRDGEYNRRHLGKGIPFIDPAIEAARKAAEKAAEATRKAAEEAAEAARIAAEEAAEAARIAAEEAAEAARIAAEVLARHLLVCDLLRGFKVTWDAAKDTAVNAVEATASVAAATATTLLNEAQAATRAVQNAANAAAAAATAAAAAAAATATKLLNEAKAATRAVQNAANAAAAAATAAAAAAAATATKLLNEAKAATRA
eukprot:scaffold6954_cov66-Phaeocystis_antarctica.AAC.1